MKYKLPRQLIKFQDIIIKSIKPVIKIDSKRDSTLLWESKIGGNPYWEIENKKYPYDKAGKPMKLLAQINFSQIPQIDLFPREGLLQFFISANDDVYGADFDDGTCQDNFRIVYHEKIIKCSDKIIQDFSFIQNMKDDYFPSQVEAKMIFRLEEEAVPMEDFHFEKYFNNSEYNVFDDEEMELYSELINSSGHKIGGYAYFTQSDPRESSYQQNEILLLQLDTDDSIDMMWGDCGVANFFIRREDLIRKDFTNVYYNWDCC